MGALFAGIEWVESGAFRGSVWLGTHCGDDGDTGYVVPE
jgi:hypothetical protein